MADSNLPRTGLQAVFEGVEKFLKDNDRVDKATEKLGKKIESTGKKTEKSSKSFGKLDNTIQGLVRRFASAVPGGNQLLNIVGDLGPALGSLSAAALATVAAVAALGIAFLSLAQRGASIKGLATGFDIQVRRVGLSAGQLLEDLDKAAAGTVSRLNLIRNANIALAGATGEFGQQFGQALPEILEIARIQARNTGQSVEYLYQSLVTGIKRSSPLLIDNTGLVLKVGEANRRYAEELGISVEALTAEQRQIALLNATLEAGAAATEAFGGAQEIAAEKEARATATIANILDTLALSVQPLYEAFLDAVNGILGLIQQLAEAVGPILSELLRFAGAVVTNVAQPIINALQPIVSFIAGLAPYVTLALRTINDLIQGIQVIVGEGLRRVVEFIRSVVGIDLGFDFAELPRRMFEGAAAVMGSFANGVITVANRLIFPAIIAIASFIRDFLMGLSPPKKGPLSTIDKGGANLMTAWLEGIAGVSLDPVKKVAQQVTDALGSVATFTRAQVERRLKELDTALIPFQNRLNIIQSQFEALSAPAEAALRAIDRQTGKLTNQVLMGDRAAAEQLRTLEAQRSVIQGRVDQQQSLVDNAQIQLALAKGQQSQERALLNIRLSQFAAQTKAAKAVQKATGRVPKTKKPTGAAAETPPAAGAGITPFPGAEDTSALDIIAGNDAVSEAQAGLIEAFSEQIDTSQLEELGAQSEELQGIFAEIGSVDIGARLRDRFPILETFENILNPVRDFVSNAFNPDAENGIFYAITYGDFSNLGTNISNALNNVASLFDTNIPTSPLARIQQAATDLFSHDNPTSIPNLFANINLQSSAANVRTAFAPLLDIFDPEIVGSPMNILRTSVESLFSEDNPTSIPNIFANVDFSGLTNLFDPDIDGSPAQQIKHFLTEGGEGTLNYFVNQAVTWFTELPGRIAEGLVPLGQTIQDNVLTPIANFLTGPADQEGTLRYILAQAVGFFRELPLNIADVLRGIGAFLYSIFVVPILNAINSLIGLVENAIRNLASSVLDIVTGIRNAASAVGIDTSGLDQFISSLNNVTNLNLPRIDTAVPEFLNAGASSVTNNSTTNITFNGVSGAGDAVNRFATLQARV